MAFLFNSLVWVFVRGMRPLHGSIPHVVIQLCAAYVLSPYHKCPQHTWLLLSLLIEETLVSRREKGFDKGYM
jgi:hypothetical protein